MPSKQLKCGRFWLNDGSCIRPRPEHKVHVWTYDFVADRTNDGSAIRMLNILDEFNRERLETRVDRKVTAHNVLLALTSLVVIRGIPKYIRSENRPEFVTDILRELLHRLDVGSLFIEPGSSWENRYIESFNCKQRDELLNEEIIDTLTEARVVIER